MLEKLGEGGASKVFLAEQLNIQRKCAIKFVNKKHEAYVHLQNEYIILKQLEHVGIPRIYDIEEDVQYLYIIEEYINGETLDKYITSNPMSEQDVVQIILQLCSILDYLHTINNEPIFYLDLKPENIVICQNKQIKLIDFGSATTQSNLLRQKVRGVTPKYSAPELFTNTQVDQRVDVYSLGKIVEFILDHNPIQISNSNLLNHILKGCIHKSPSGRFASIESINSYIQKNLTKITKEQSKQLCILGSQRRIGTTYLSIIVAKILERKGYKVLIQEQENQTSLDHLIERNQIKITAEGSYELKGLYFKPASIPNNNQHYDFIIEDCGEIYSDNLPKADGYLLVMGTREWELCYAENLIHKLSQVENKLFLMNLTSKSMYRFIKKGIGTPVSKRCIQVPYIKDPFIGNVHLTKQIVEGLESIYCLKEKRNKKIKKGGR